MAASFNLVLDTSAPASPTLTINDRASTTGDRVVWAALGTADHDAGANDVSSMKIWGDVDPDADPAIATTEASSEWLPYQSQVAVMLSAGDGVKALHARLRDDVGNVTLEVSNSIILDSTVPVVTVTTSVSRGRISKVSPYDVSAFTWTASTDVDHYEVRVVPGPGFPHGSGVLLGTAHGAENTSGGPVASGEPVTTSITGSDLEAASPGDTTKVIKVFVRTAAGKWSV